MVRRDARWRHRWDRRPSYYLPRGHGAEADDFEWGQRNCRRVQVVHGTVGTHKLRRHVLFWFSLPSHAHTGVHACNFGIESVAG